MLQAMVVNRKDGKGANKIEQMLAIRDTQKPYRFTGQHNVRDSYIPQTREACQYLTFTSYLRRRCFLSFATTAESASLATSLHLARLGRARLGCCDVDLMFVFVLFCLFLFYLTFVYLLFLHVAFGGPACFCIKFAFLTPPNRVRKKRGVLE